MAEFTQPELIAFAEGFARAAHRNQRRRGKRHLPYYTHLRAVAASVEPRLKPAAWLHDVVEDTEICFTDLLSAGFPHHVISIVDTLSRRPGQSYHNFITRALRSRDACIVKLADINHNLSDNPTPEAAERYRLSLLRIYRKYPELRPPAQIL